MYINVEIQVVHINLFHIAETLVFCVIGTTISPSTRQMLSYFAIKTIIHSQYSQLAQFTAMGVTLLSRHLQLPFKYI